MCVCVWCQCTQCVVCACVWCQCTWYVVCVFVFIRDDVCLCSVCICVVCGVHSVWV